MNPSQPPAAPLPAPSPSLLSFLLAALGPDLARRGVGALGRAGRSALKHPAFQELLDNLSTFKPYDLIKALKAQYDAIPAPHRIARHYNPLEHRAHFDIAQDAQDVGMIGDDLVDYFVERPTSRNEARWPFYYYDFPGPPPHKASGGYRNTATYEAAQTDLNAIPNFWETPATVHGKTHLGIAGTRNERAALKMRPGHPLPYTPRLILQQSRPAAGMRMDQADAIEFLKNLSLHHAESAASLNEEIQP